MEKKDFTITKVSWLTKRPGLNISREIVIQEHYFLALFLQKNNLTTKQILNENQQIDDNFCIKASDLTDEGLLFIKKGFEKWLDAIDRGQDPSNMKILEKALEKIKNK